MGRLLKHVQTVSRDQMKELRAWTKIHDAHVVALKQNAELRRQTLSASERLTAPPPGLIAWQREPVCVAFSPQAHSVFPSRETSLSQTLMLYHDCPFREVSLRQIQNFGRGARTPFALKCDVFEFGGSYFSFRIDVPFSNTLRRDQILSLRSFVDCEEGVEIHARLNLSKGAHTEQLIKEAKPNNPLETTEFDLHFCETRFDGSQSAWFDLTFSNIAFSCFAIRDIVVIQARRADA